jgi:CRISPR-associated endonuclease Cas1
VTPPYTLPTHPTATSQIPRSGIVTVHGHGARIYVQAAHLQVQYGVGPDRSTLRLPRVPHRLKRVICISEDGFITFSAMKWLSDIGAAFIMLDRLGKVRLVTGPTSNSDARLKRAQCLAHQSGKALEISRELIRTKLEGEERVVREQLNQPNIADAIARIRNRLVDVENLDSVRYLEARSAQIYWGAWSQVPVLFPQEDARRVPNHWLQFGSRHSPLTGGPRLAINPANAILNFCFAIAESECRLALSICGIDPAIGFIHLDTPRRDSMALDVLETIRPSIEAWLLSWITREPLRRSDFFETGTGNCRLMSRLCSELSETAPTWGRLVAPWAEYVAHSLRASHTSLPRAARGFSTPLTQAHRRNVKVISPPVLKMPKVERICHGCGTRTRVGRNCPKCGREISGKKLIELAKVGRVAALSPEARRKHSETQRRHEAAKQAWHLTPKSAWPTENTYVERIQPTLGKVTIAKISSTLGVCESYAADIRAGRYRPHPRHWQALARLVGISQNE